MFGPEFELVSTFLSLQLDRVFCINVYANLYITCAAILFLLPGSLIINTASIVASNLVALFVDYAASKAAVVSIT
jgi:NAD(P)-dependent dehydrogenase (short-subunit alcohol dehydrogenase family)